MDLSMEEDQLILDSFQKNLLWMHYSWGDVVLQALRMTQIHFSLKLSFLQIMLKDCPTQIHYPACLALALYKETFYTDNLCWNLEANMMQSDSK